VDDANMAVKLARRCADSGELTRERPTQGLKMLLRIAESTPDIERLR
jgi:aldehyde dehydrogenase (NAD+)